MSGNNLSRRSKLLMPFQMKKSMPNQKLFMHFWSDKDVNFARTKPYLFRAAIYNYNLWIHEMPGMIQHVHYVIVDGEKLMESTSVSGWAEWSNPTIENILVEHGQLQLVLPFTCTWSGVP